MKQLFPQHFAEQGSSPVQQAQPQQASLPTAAVPATMISNVTPSQQKSYTIENHRYQLVVNAPGADIQKIELKQLLDPETKQPTILMDVENKYPGIFATSDLLSGAELKDVIVGAENIQFAYITKDFEVKKTIALDPETYSITALIEVQNKQTDSKPLEYALTAATGLKNVSGLESRFREAVTISQNNKISKKNINGIQKAVQLEGEIKLAGFKARYFSIIAAPFVECWHILLSRVFLRG